MMKSLFLLIFLALAISVNGQSPADTVRTGPSGMQRLADSVASSMTAPPSQQTQTRKIKIIRKDVHYSPFIILAIGMMAFIALIYTTTQTYNPS